MQSARAIIKEAYNGYPNILTSEIVAYGYKGGFAWELSKGGSLLGPDQEPIWGVTVVRVHPREKMYDLSQCLSSEAQARAYIRAGFPKLVRTA